MAGSDKVVYLNGDAGLMAGGLLRAMSTLPAKLQRAPAKEWLNTLKSLVSKGLVKQSEIDDTDVEGWFLTQEAGKPIQRSDLEAAIKQRQVTIKEVELGTPQYRSYSHFGIASPSARYAEVLFIANSERANLQDQLALIEWELEQFNFDIERLSNDPDGVIRLTEQRASLMAQSKVSYDFKWKHFTSVEHGAHGRNLIAHARELRDGSIYLVEEIQSDWGQRGRRQDWKSIPKGPFVTDTKLWAGLAMRRMMQRAALDPKVERFYWIRGSMRNGGIGVVKDNLDEFYLKVMSGIVDKVIGPAKQKARLEVLRLGEHAIADVPCFDMTPEVRELLVKTLPLYSLADLLPRPRTLGDDQKAMLLKSAKTMIGSTRNVRLASHVYDIALGREVAGSYINGMVQVSLRSADLTQVMNHECFHFGMDKLFTLEEQRLLRESFAPGSTLNKRVRRALRSSGSLDAERQCSDADEAAAHGFALWAQGRLSMAGEPAQTIFQELRDTVAACLSWFRMRVLKEEVKTVEGLFESFARGDYAEAGSKAQERSPSPLEIPRREAMRAQ